MAGKYLGHLATDDPLHRYLRREILPQIGVESRHADYRVFKLGGTSDVYRYEERHSGRQFIGKFFATRHEQNPVRAARLAELEFRNLNQLRSYGLTTQPHTVVRPLGYNLNLNSLLVVEYQSGDSLSRVINDAIHHGREERLLRKLAALAFYLATQHNRTANGQPVDFNEDCCYLDRLVSRLLDYHTIDWDDSSEFQWLRERWREQPHMWEDNQVMVHGDATPSNFLFSGGKQVVALDLERMKRADRVFDVGRLSGELQHFFLNATGNKYAAEPFIGHFLWEYCGHFPDRQLAFRAITARVPFHMGLTLLRIARNPWISPEHRARLIVEAKILLRHFAL